MLNPDLCTSIIGGKIQSQVHTLWGKEDFAPSPVTKKFTSFKVESRLERRTESDPKDTVVSSVTCDFTDALNRQTSNADFNAYVCASPQKSLTAGLWSTDSTITYDVEGDGKGLISWELTGSPLFSER